MLEQSYSIHGRQNGNKQPQRELSIRHSLYLSARYNLYLHVFRDLLPLTSTHNLECSESSKIMLPGEVNTLRPEPVGDIIVCSVMSEASAVIDTLVLVIHT